LNLLLGFLHPVAGEIMINGSRVEDWSGLRRSVAYVKQQPFLIHDSIRRNITLNEEAVDKERMAQSVRMAGLFDLVQQYPEKYEKIIGEGGKNISGGQRKRLAIARALYKNAGVIILDEPFSELDAQSEAELTAHFKKLAEQGHIVIMVTHSRASLAACNKIFDFDAR
jgi:ABC-type bacteriocin/lantibiotic exporter with double-glycine peptidase domain